MDQTNNKRFQLITLEELLAKYQGSRIPYEELLMTPQWAAARIAILQRDKEKCRNCNTPKTEYAWGRNVYWVWNYDNKVVKKEFWDRFNAHRKITGNENSTIQPREDEYEYVPEYWYETMVTLDVPVSLHVHHKYYIDGLWPWQYSPEALITLCNWCHSELHAREKVPYYKNIQMDEEVHLTPCSRCHGAGFLPQYNYHKNGICFKCNGHKYDEFI